jgi:Putative prokaryotic signal transducing protein
MANPSSHEMKPDLVTIRTFSNEFEALVAQSVLETAGIDCMISADDCAGLRPYLTQGIKLIVRSDEADRAKEVLPDEAQD